MQNIYVFQIEGCKCHEDGICWQKIENCAFVYFMCQIKNSSVKIFKCYFAFVSILRYEIWCVVHSFTNNFKYYKFNGINSLVCLNMDFNCLDEFFIDFSMLLPHFSCIFPLLYDEFVVLMNGFNQKVAVVTNGADVQATTDKK